MEEYQITSFRTGDAGWECRCPKTHFSDGLQLWPSLVEPGENGWKQTYLRDFLHLATAEDNTGFRARETCILILAVPLISWETSNINLTPTPNLHFFSINEGNLTRLPDYVLTNNWDVLTLLMNSAPWVVISCSCLFSLPLQLLGSFDAQQGISHSSIHGWHLPLLLSLRPQIPASPGRLTDQLRSHTPTPDYRFLPCSFQLSVIYLVCYLASMEKWCFTTKQANKQKTAYNGLE